MKKIIKKDRVIILLSIMALIVTAILWVFHLKSDWKYMVIQTFKSTTTSKFDGEIVNVDTQKVSINEAKKMKNVSFQQNLMLVNKGNTIDENFNAKLLDYNGQGLLMNTCIVSDYKKLSSSIKDKFNENLFVMSSYRTAEEQQELFE